MDFQTLLSDWRFWVGLLAVAVAKWVIDNVLGSSKAPPAKVYSQADGNT